VSQNRVLRRKFGPKRDEVTGSRRKLHNEELYNVYSAASVIRMIKSRRMKCSEHVACMEEQDAYRVLMRRSEEKRPLRIPRRMWEDNTKMDVEEIMVRYILD
jgi:hypothetical protein